MNELSRNEWIGVGAAVIVVAVVALPAIGLLPSLMNNNETASSTTSMSSSTAESFEITPGLTAAITQEGAGEVAQAGQEVTVHYRGTLEDGTQFDASYDRGEPFTFTLGAGQVIAGWDQGVVGMREGEIRQLTIAPELGYGPQGITNPQTGEAIIPQNATLLFDVELLDAGTSVGTSTATTTLR